MGHWEANGQSDDWYTPKYIFDALDCVFDMDVACPEDRTFISVPANHFISTKSLDLEWNGFVWMNPPFGNRNGIVPWIDKLYRHGNGIALTPDRTSAPWWQDAAEKADAILFIRGKVKFIKPDGSTGDSPSTGTTLFAFGKAGIRGLMNAELNNLGKFLR
jgi:hypothetical protein